MNPLTYSQFFAYINVCVCVCRNGVNDLRIGPRSKPQCYCTMGIARRRRVRVTTVMYHLTPETQIPFRLLRSSITPVAPVYAFSSFPCPPFRHVDPRAHPGISGCQFNQPNGIWLDGNRHRVVVRAPQRAEASGFSIRRVLSHEYP